MSSCYKHTADRTILTFDNDNDDRGNFRLTDALLKESNHISNSERALDEQLELAEKTRETLKNQRSIIKSMQTKYNDITNMFPVIGNLMSKIQMRKRRDTIVLAVVFCLALGLLLYNLF